MATAKASTALALVIQNTRGASLLAPNRSHIHRIEIPNSNGTRKYVVAMNNTGGVHHGRWECSCPGWVTNQHKPAFGGCKHLKAMLPHLSRIRELG